MKNSAQIEKEKEFKQLLTEEFDQVLQSTKEKFRNMHPDFFEKNKFNEIIKVKCSFTGISIISNSEPQGKTISRENRASLDDLAKVKEILKVIDSSKRREKYLHVLEELIKTHNVPIEGRYLFPNGFAWSDMMSMNKFLTDNHISCKLLHTEPHRRDRDFRTSEYAFFQV